MYENNRLPSTPDLPDRCTADHKVEPTNRYQTVIQGTWTGSDKNRKYLYPFDVTVKIDATNITITFPNDKPSYRDNPTVWGYKFISMPIQEQPVLQISETYNWNIIFHDDKTITATSNNDNEDIFNVNKAIADQRL